MVKLFLIKSDGHGFDQFEAFVVRAEDEADALLVCKEELAHYDQVWTINDVKITEILMQGKKEIILGNFHSA